MSVGVPYKFCCKPVVLHQVRVLGEGFTPEDEEDSAAAEVSKVWAYQARYRVPLAKATAGTSSTSIF